MQSVSQRLETELISQIQTHCFYFQFGDPNAEHHFLCCTRSNQIIWVHSMILLSNWPISCLLPSASWCVAIWLRLSCILSFKITVDCLLLICFGISKNLFILWLTLDFLFTFWISFSKNFVTIFPVKIFCYSILKVILACEVKNNIKS